MSNLEVVSRKDDRKKKVLNPEHKNKMSPSKVDINKYLGQKS